MAKRRKSSSMLPAGADPRRSGSSRPVQVGEAVKQALGELLGEGGIKDPRIAAASLVTITDVEMTPDLRLARVYFSVFPSDDALLKSVWKGLRSAAREMRRHLGATLGLRFTPELEFRVDGSIAEGAKIETILREIREEDAGEER